MLENALETADAMKSRGYGLPGRTAFSIFRFDKRDRKALCVLLFAGGYVAAGAANGAVRFRYFPSMRGSFFDAYTISIFFVYGLLCLFPVVINCSEDQKWNSLQSAD
jgi:energy-coupling factor transport system permease protein